MAVNGIKNNHFFIIKMEDLPKYNNYVFTGARRVYCMDSFGDDYDNTDIIVKNTDLLDCITQINKIRDDDITNKIGNKYKHRACCGVTI